MAALRLKANVEQFVPVKAVFILERISYSNSTQPRKLTLPNGDSYLPCSIKVQSSDGEVISTHSPSESLFVSSGDAGVGR